MLFLHDIYHIIRMEQDNLYNLLQSIDTPDDLRHLSADKLPEVCKELRQKIIDELSCNPGHFGSSLGVIELTVALHYVFNTPYDRIVWDVERNLGDSDKRQMYFSLTAEGKKILKEMECCNIEIPELLRSVL